jgi:hypothetical protein
MWMVRVGKPGIIYFTLSSSEKFKILRVAFIVQ